MTHDVSHELRAPDGKWVKTRRAGESKILVGFGAKTGAPFHVKARKVSVGNPSARGGAYKTEFEAKHGTTITRGATRTEALNRMLTHFADKGVKFRDQPAQTYPEIHAADLSTPDARRSPAVSSAKFQKHAQRGAAKIEQMKGKSSPATALEGPQFKRITDDAYAATREPWGGITVDTHTGEHVPADADAYALTVRDHEPLSIDPGASREDFDNAMDEARKRFAEELSRPGAHLGVFHDQDTNKIDFDPVLVTPNLADVHDIGAFTHAVGGAYHFQSGDGYWPPHVVSVGPSNSEKIANAATMYGTRSKQHLAAIKRFGQEKKMDLAFNTPTLHGGDYELSSDGGGLAFWKQILPMKSIHYTSKSGKRSRLDFTREYLTDLASAQAVDSVGFLLADKDNAHTMDPERFRGKVAKMEVRDDGLYGKIVFPSVEAAKAVLDNPDLGVSARIRESVQRSDGSTVPRGIIHVLGTLDPQVSGMSPWQSTDLSTQDEVLDLSEQEYEDMATNDKALSDYTEDDLDKMTEQELDTFLAEFLPEFDAYTGEHEAEAEEAEADNELVTAGANMSKQVQDDLDLANQAVARANSRAEEALARVAEAEWREERASLLADGVPPHALDLAQPVLNRADDMVIDLSNTDEDDVNVSKVVRDLLDSMKGMVDLSVEEGHAGTFDGNGEDPDKAYLDLWEAQG